MKTVPLQLLWHYNAFELGHIWERDEALCRKYAALETPFPEIVLAQTRNGYQIEDGAHRVVAATLRGDREISCRRRAAL